VQNETLEGNQETSLPPFEAQHEDVGSGHSVKPRCWIRWAVCVSGVLLLVIVIRFWLCGDHVDALIEQLVEKEVGEAGPDSARAAYDRLRRLGTKAYPYLISGTKDKRKVWRCFQLAQTGRTSVGGLCFAIIRSQVEAPFPPLAGLTFLHRDHLDEWWRERRCCSLRELQIEALAWAVAEMKSKVSEMKSNELSSRIDDLEFFEKCFTQRTNDLAFLENCLAQLQVNPKAIFEDRHISVSP